MIHPEDIIHDSPETRILNRMNDLVKRQRQELSELADEFKTVLQEEQRETTNAVVSDASENLETLHQKLNTQLRRNVARRTLDVVGLYAELPHAIRTELERVQEGAMEGEVPALIVVPRRGLSGRHPEKAFAIIDVSDVVLRQS